MASDTGLSYDAVAASYADFAHDVLERRPHLLTMLWLFAIEVQASGSR